MCKTSEPSLDVGWKFFLDGDWKYNPVFPSEDVRICHYIVSNISGGGGIAVGEFAVFWMKYSCSIITVVINNNSWCLMSLSEKSRVLSNSFLESDELQRHGEKHAVWRSLCVLWRKWFMTADVILLGCIFMFCFLNVQRSSLEVTCYFIFKADKQVSYEVLVFW